jgi:hypothetical protein
MFLLFGIHVSEASTCNEGVELPGYLQMISNIMRHPFTTTG